MKYVVMGVGGVGGYFGARLAAHGNEVAFIARGRHAEALRRHGLSVTSPLGDVHIEHPDVPGDMAHIGFADIILFCVKLWDVEAAAEQLKPLLASDTAVIPFQNGVSVTERLEKILGRKHVMGGVAKISATLERPGHIRHVGTLAALIFGELDGHRSWRAECMDAACQGAGIEARLSENIALDLWEKFVFLAPMAAAACLERAPIGTVLGERGARARLVAMIEEAVAVGRAKGIALPPDAAERALAGARLLPDKAKPSMLVDLEHGRQLELDWLTGEVARLGRDFGVATPISSAAYEDLKPFAMGSRSA